MGKPWSTLEERARLREVMAAVLRDCARTGVPVPSHRRWPAIVLERAAIDVSERHTRRAMRGLLGDPPGDLELRCVGRHRQVRVMLSAGRGGEDARWSAFTPMAFALATSAANRERAAARDDDDDDDDLDAAARHHLDRLSAAAATRGQPVEALYR